MCVCVCACARACVSSIHTHINHLPASILKHTELSPYLLSELIGQDTKCCSAESNETHTMTTKNHTTSATQPRVKPQMGHNHYHHFNYATLYHYHLTKSYLTKPKSTFYTTKQELLISLQTYHGKI